MARALLQTRALAKLDTADRTATSLVRQDFGAANAKMNVDVRMAPPAILTMENVFVPGGGKASIARWLVPTIPMVLNVVRNASVNMVTAIIFPGSVIAMQDLWDLYATRSALRVNTAMNARMIAVARMAAIAIHKPAYVPVQKAGRAPFVPIDAPSVFGV